MATEASLRPGGTYFLVGFEDASFTHPLISTYEFIGKDDDGATDDSEKTQYIFRIVDSDGDELVLTEKQIWQALDFDDLIQKLTDLRDGKVE